MMLVCIILCGIVVYQELEKHAKYGKRLLEDYIRENEPPEQVEQLTPTP